MIEVFFEVFFAFDLSFLQEDLAEEGSSDGRKKDLVVNAHLLTSVFVLTQQVNKGQATQLMCLLIVQGSPLFSSSSRSVSCKQDRPP